LAIVVLSVIVLVVAVLITWLTQYDEGGFPFQWKTLGVACLALGCPPPTDQYDWTAFALDALLYAAIGYSLLWILVKFAGGKIAGFPQKTDLKLAPSFGDGILTAGQVIFRNIRIITGEPSRILEMKPRSLALALAIAGLGAGIAAIVISEQNHGSCPLATVGSPPCDHTFPGTTIWIGQTAREISIVAFALLISSVAVALYGRLAKHHQT